MALVFSATVFFYFANCVISCPSLGYHFIGSDNPIEEYEFAKQISMIHDLDSYEKPLCQDISKMIYNIPSLCLNFYFEQSNTNNNVALLVDSLNDYLFHWIDLGLSLSGFIYTKQSTTLFFVSFQSHLSDLTYKFGSCQKPNDNYFYKIDWSNVDIANPNLLNTDPENSFDFSQNSIHFYKNFDQGNLQELIDTFDFRIHNSYKLDHDNHAIVLSDKKGGCVAFVSDEQNAVQNTEREAYWNEQMCQNACNDESETFSLLSESTNDQDTDMGSQHHQRYFMATLTALMFGLIMCGLYYLFKKYKKRRIRQRIDRLCDKNDMSPLIE